MQELVDASQHSAVKLIKLLVDNFSSYKDVAVYKGRRGLWCFLCCYVIKYGSIVKIKKIKNTLVLCTTQNTEYYGGI